MVVDRNSKEAIEKHGGGDNKTKLVSCSVDSKNRTRDRRLIIIFFFQQDLGCQAPLLPVKIPPKIIIKYKLILF